MYFQKLKFAKGSHDWRRAKANFVVLHGTTPSGSIKVGSNK